MDYCKKKKCMISILLLVFAFIISGCSFPFQSTHQDISIESEENNYNENYKIIYPENNEQILQNKKNQEVHVPHV